MVYCVLLEGSHDTILISDMPDFLIASVLDPATTIIILFMIIPPYGIPLIIIKYSTH